MSAHSYIRTISGLKFYYENPTVDMIDIGDIAWSLSRMPRFLGHTLGKPYSTLQHCCLVHDLAPLSCKKEALGHDYLEYVMSDISSPCKSLLPDYRDLEHKTEKVIAEKFGLQHPFPPEVKVADLIALATEMKCLTNSLDYQDLPYPPSKTQIKVWSPKKARNEFFKRFNKLYS